MRFSFIPLLLLSRTSIVMTSSARNSQPFRLRLAVTVILLLSLLSFLSSDSVRSGAQIPRVGNESQQGRKMVLGSRPPGCVNKCMNCRPCKAALVIPPHKTKPFYAESSSHGEDGSYYLLSWKCRCGNKLFQP